MFSHFPLKDGVSNPLKPYSKLLGAGNLECFFLCLKRLDTLNSHVNVVSAGIRFHICCDLTFIILTSHVVFTGSRYGPSKLDNNT